MSQVPIASKSAATDFGGSPISPHSAGQPQAINSAVSVSGAVNNLSRHVCNVEKTTGTPPPGLVGASTTIVGDKLYAFGGRRNRSRGVQLTNRLYELDLVQRHWTRLMPTGDVPSPRYFHSMCPLGDTKLVCFGGMAPALDRQDSPRKDAATGPPSEPKVTVMADVHFLDLRTLKWDMIPTSNAPPGRYAHCAAILPSSGVFTSSTAAHSSLQHNLSSDNPNQGALGVSIDGRGGAEMVVVGGQDNASNYVEQINVFNLRSLKWTGVTAINNSCGAYRSVVAPVVGLDASQIGVGYESSRKNSTVPEEQPPEGTSALMYSNYNFLDVKLELLVRSPDGRLKEHTMHGSTTPPGLRFPTGGVIKGHLIISGTFLTSSKQEYALWALNLSTLTWSRIDVGGGIFSSGSWNRGVVWHRRNAFVVLGDHRRSLADDYNQRRLNFSNACIVELEAYGLYESPRAVAPTSDYVSGSSSVLPSRLDAASGGRACSVPATRLGESLITAHEAADLDLLSFDGKRTPVNSQLISRRWGPYFAQLLRESAAAQENGASSSHSASDAATLRPGIASHPSRNSAITITPSTASDAYSVESSGSSSNATMLGPGYSPSSASAGPSAGTSKRSNRQTLDAYRAPSLAPTSRPRELYLPHTQLTVEALAYYLYTSALPPPSSPRASTQVLCSLLQIARPYRVDGLLEAVKERMHASLDPRNAAAVFNAAAMAAGGGDGVTFAGDLSARTANASAPAMFQRYHTQRRATSNNATMPQHARTDSLDTESEGEGVSSASSSSASLADAFDEDVWTGDVSAVVGLQLRGLRGLLEGRRIRDGSGGGTPGVKESSFAGLGGGEG